MSVVGKFIVSANEPGDVSVQKIKLRAVAPGDTDDVEEDARFHRYTPNGTIEMQVDNPPVVGYFETGQAYKVTFEKVKVPVA